MIINQRLKTIFKVVTLSVTSIVSAIVFAQAPQPDVEQIRWKTETQVRSLLGEPNTVHGPVGTHASYKLWKYDNFTVAFANERAFHLFNKNSLHKLKLEENR